MKLLTTQLFLDDTEKLLSLLHYNGIDANYEDSFTIPRYYTIFVNENQFKKAIEINRNFIKEIK